MDKNTLYSIDDF